MAISSSIRVFGRWLDGDPIVLGFSSFKLLQNMVLFAAVYCYYRKLRLGRGASLVGLGVLGWSVTYSLYDSDLSFDLYSELILFALAGVLLFGGREKWLPALIAVAAVNRETSALILLLFLVQRFKWPGGWDRRTVCIALLATAVFALEYAGLRAILGPRPMFEPYGHSIGMDLLTYNLFRRVTWVNLAATWSIFPLTALAGIRFGPRALGRFFWVVCLIWIPIHFITAIVAETRLMLMPQMMVFIPLTLVLIQKERRNDGK
jgi:hypothetical protein